MAPAPPGRLILGRLGDGDVKFLWLGDRLQVGRAHCQPARGTEAAQPEDKEHTFKEPALCLLSAGIWQEAWRQMYLLQQRENAKERRAHRWPARRVEVALAKFSEHFVIAAQSGEIIYILAHSLKHMQKPQEHCPPAGNPRGALLQAPVDATVQGDEVVQRLRTRILSRGKAQCFSAEHLRPSSRSCNWGYRSLVLGPGLSAFNRCAFDPVV